MAAPLLGLTLERLLGDRRAGKVYHITEEGEREWSRHSKFPFVIISSPPLLVCDPVLHIS
jgi:hypothetical protein